MDAKAGAIGGIGMLKRSIGYLLSRELIAITRRAGGSPVSRDRHLRRRDHVLQRHRRSPSPRSCSPALAEARSAPAAGPRIYGLDELIQSYLATTHRQRPIVSVPLPTIAAGAIRSGANLAPERAVGRRTWEEFLADRVDTMQGEAPPHSRPDLREQIAARVLRLVNPLARWMIPAGIPTGAPNVLLTVRGRRSGTRRTVPVCLLELEGRRFVQASYGVAGWAVNLRAAGEAIMTEHGRSTPVQAVELPPKEAGAILRRALEPYRRSRLLHALLGPRWRPPVALLRQYRIRVDDTPEEYVADARRHPLFELRVMKVDRA